MKGATNIDSELENELSAVAEQAGCELVHAEYKGGNLRVFIDRPEGGVTIDDCQTVSKQLSALLDVHDFGRKRYILEVSSPGLDRQLYRPRDYQRFTGHRVRVTFLEDAGEAGGRHKKTVTGRLASFHPTLEDEAIDTSGEDAEIVLEEDPAGQPRRIALADILVARLEVEL